MLQVLLSIVLSANDFNGYATYVHQDVTAPVGMQPDGCNTGGGWGIPRLSDADAYFRQVWKPVCEVSPTCATGQNCHMLGFPTNSSLVSYINLHKTGLQGQQITRENGTCMNPAVSWLVYLNYDQLSYQVTNVYNIPPTLCEQQCSGSSACGGFQVYKSMCLILQLVDRPSSDGRSTFLKLPTGVKTKNSNSA